MSTSSRARVWGLLLVLIALRLPLVNHPWPIHPDEVDFVHALGFPAQYPVHHPGYPLWVAMGTALAALGIGPYAAYQAWSIIASIFAPLVFHRWLSGVIDEPIAWWLALAFGVSPVFAFVSMTALNYSAGCLVGLLVVAFAWRTVAESRSDSPAKAAWALAVGALLRPDLLAWLGPLVVWSAWRRRAAGGVRALWPVPVGALAAWIAAWLLYGRADFGQAHPDLRHTVAVFLNTSVLRLGLVDGLARNAVKLAASLGWTFGLGAVLIVIGIVRIRRIAARTPSFVRLLTLWTLPLSMFLLFIHMSEPGHAILLVPAGYALAGATLSTLGPPRAAARLAAVLALATAAQFYLYPWSAQQSGPLRVLDAKIAYQSAKGLLMIDRRGAMHTIGDVWPTAAHRRPPGAPPSRVHPPG